MIKQKEGHPTGTVSEILPGVAIYPFRFLMSFMSCILLVCLPLSEPDIQARGRHILLSLSLACGFVNLSKLTMFNNTILMR